MSKRGAMALKRFLFAVFVCFIALLFAAEAVPKKKEVN